VSVNHGGLHVLVAEQFLDGANVVTILEEMRGKTVPEGVGRDGLVDSRKLGGAFDSFLQAGFVEMVALFEAGNGICGKVGGGECILPGPFTVGVWVFLFEGIWQIYCAIAVENVFFVHRLDLFEMQAQGFEQTIGEHGDAIVFALAIANDDLVVGEVKVFDPQAVGPSRHRGGTRNSALGFQAGEAAAEYS
jgi:hypothetical protein